MNVIPTPVRVEHRTDPGPVLGLGIANPRLSWSVASAPSDYAQTAYELEISRLDQVRTFVVESDEQILVSWPDAPLRSRESATVRVRVRSEEWGGWSDSTVVEAGLLEASDWEARFISPVGIGGLRQAAPEVRGNIELSGIVSARLHASAHGVYTARINGIPVDDTVLAPGWTSYEHRLRYRTYDVTALLRDGANELTATLGNGWWRGRLGFLGERARYGEKLAFLAQLEVTLGDGSVRTLVTDDGWAARASSILTDDLYDGQTTDLRLGSGAFDTPVTVLGDSLDVLVGEDGPPVRRTQVLSAVEVSTSPSGRTIVDFGQNVVGWVRLRTHGLTEGSEVIIRHAEVLEDGELGVEPLRSAKATDTYFVRGDAEETLEPSLTFHGFRYADITGVPDVGVADVQAIVIGSDLERTGWFDSSDPLLNRFHENVVWGMRGNFLDVPTDCPQRDERLGWTGDIQVFAPTATYLFDSSGFLTSWLADLAAEQLPNGSVPHVVPDILRTDLTSAPAAAWGDAATVVPWVLWERTGDRDVLRRQFPSMAAWVDGVADRVGDDLIWRGGFQYGDWLDPTAPHDDAAAAAADPDVIATAHFARSARIVADAADVIGELDAARHYGDLADRVRCAFDRAFVTADGRVLSDAQTVYAIALEWGLIDGPVKRRRAGDRLADLVRRGAFRIATGFVGTPVICDALTNAGYPELAFRLLFQTEAPSWLYPVTMGATTVWERWDSLLPDGRINPSGMTSFNHYALGSVIDWVHRRIAGLAPAAPGYREIAVRPIPPVGLERAAASHVTPYGEAAVSWHRSDGQWTLEVTVPVGCRAVVELPWGAGTTIVGHGDHRWLIDEPQTVPAEIRTVRDLVDDESAWRRFADAAVSSGAVPSEARAAHLLATHWEDNIFTLPEGVWTKGWPSAATKMLLAAAVEGVATESTREREDASHA